MTMTWVMANPLARLYYDKWNFCGCGSPDDIIELMEKILDGYMVKRQHLADPKNDRGYWEQGSADIKAACGPNESMYHFMLQWLDSQKLTEHGGSVYGAWITDYGVKVHEVIKTYKNSDWTNADMEEFDGEPEVDQVLQSP